MHWAEQTPSSNNTGEDYTLGHHQMPNTDQINYILCSQRWRSFIQSAKTRPGAGCEKCGSDHEILIAKFRLKLKKVGKTTGLFRYDLIQIPYDYTVEVRNRCKAHSDRQSAWRTMDRGSWHCTGDREQDHPQEKEMQNSSLRRPYK